MISFVEIALEKPEHGTIVTFLGISIKVSALERDFFRKTLAMCLSLTPNIEIFELSTMPPITIASFADVPLARLEVFKTNTPHRAVRSFVAAHPSLSTIDLGSCGRAIKCSTAPMKLDHVTDIRCPVRCTPGIVHGRIDCLRLDNPHDHVVASTVIRQIPVSLDVLYVLTVEFNLG